MFHKREQIDQLLNQTNLPNSSIFFKGSKKPNFNTRMFCSFIQGLLDASLSDFTMNKRC